MLNNNIANCKKYSYIIRIIINYQHKYDNQFIVSGFSTAERTWLPAADGYEHLNMENQRAAVRSHYQVYRTLTTLRRRPAFRLGRFESIALKNDVFAFKRFSASLNTYFSKSEIRDSHLSWYGYVRKEIVIEI